MTTSTPPDLPVPVDDGACDHLVGAALPSTDLAATTGGTVDLSAAGGWVVVYVYPRTGRPGVAVPPEWDAIPGARGCTPHNCSYRDEHAGFVELGASVFGLSAMTAAEQAEFAAREHIPFPLLADPGLTVADRLKLPTFTFAGETLYRRVTLVARDGEIVKVRYPVFPPAGDAAAVLGYLREAMAAEA